MILNVKNIGYLIGMLLSFTITQAQVTFVAKLSKNKLGINERLRVDFEMNKDGDNFSPPNFEGFRVVGGPNQAVSNSWINGKRSFSKTYSYFLSPLSKGNVTIGQATIEVDGQVYKTSPIAVTITSAVQLNQDGDNADYIASENVHLVAEISNSNPFLNEAITVVYKLYVSNDVSITSNWREIDTPKYADFWSQNIDNKGNFKISEGKYNGEDYRFVVLRTTVLYPQKTGPLAIEPLTLDVPIDVRSNRRDLFGRYLMKRVNKIISAGNRTITVKPLPQKGKPEGFTGAVGNFNFSVVPSKQQLDANESLELEVTVSGKGNLKLFDLPQVKLPSSLEVYEPTRNDSIQTGVAGMSGKIAETYTIVPQFKGDYPIRPITFSYFDPKTETYKTLSSQEIIINVENGPITASTNTPSNNSQKQVVVADNNKFKYIKLKANLEPKEQKDFFKSTVFWTMLGAPIVIIPLFILLGNKRRKRLNDFEGNKLRRANKLAKKFLGEAKKNLSNSETFYESLERALHNYLKAKLSIETSDFSKDHIAKLLTERSVSDEVVSEFISLLKNCEFARYAGVSEGSLKKDYEMAVASLSKIDKQFQ